MIGLDPAWYSHKYLHRYFSALLSVAPPWNKQESRLLLGTPT